MAIPRLNEFKGPPILSYGFRPFFLFGSVYAAMIMLVWLPMVFGRIRLVSLFPPVDWHVHEMIFGYLAAIVTGFLLTAVPNWTGRFPIQGLPLLALLSLWLAGRLAVTFSSSLGWLAAAAVDSLFLLAVALAIGVEIVAGRNWRNLKVLVPVLVLIGANCAFHLEVRLNGTSDLSRRLAISASIALIMLIGGRIIPSFTRNWLARNNPGRLPAAFGRTDVASIVVSLLALALWVAAPSSVLTGTAMAAAGAANAIRLSRWAGVRAWRDPLVAILHVSYAFIPAGFLLAAVAALWPLALSPAAGMHAFGTGAIGAMTLSVMVRASRGHTGRPLVAGRAETVIFAAIVIAALVRIAATADLLDQDLLVSIAGYAWILAFAGFVATNGPALLKRRKM